MECVHDLGEYIIPNTTMTLFLEAPDCTMIVPKPPLTLSLPYNGQWRNFTNAYWSNEVDHLPSCVSICTYYFDTCGTGS